MTASEISKSNLKETKGCLTPGMARRVCVYCGASRGTDPAYVEAARQLGAALAKANLELVYGGGTDGIMGVVAQAVLANGGRVTGIIPTFLTHQCATALVGSHDLVVVEHMHARKQAMFDKADAFIALPGGLGTLEELVEQMTWLKLGRHTKPLIIADIQDFWHPLLGLIDHMNACGFLGAEWIAPFQVCRSVPDILIALQAHLATPEFSDESGRQITQLSLALFVETAEPAVSLLPPPRQNIHPIEY